MIKELKEKAEKATRGPWEYCIFDDEHLEFGVHAPEHPDAVKSNLDEPWHMDHAVTVCKGMTGGKREDNAQYIAAANPQTILELIKRLESAEKALEHYKDSDCERCFEEYEVVEPEIVWDHGERAREYFKKYGEEK